MTDRHDHVDTVRGPVPLDALGPTLMHEHILNDCRCWWRGHEPGFASPLMDAAVTPALAWQLRADPFACLDNCALDDEAAAIGELGLFAAEGGRTVVDPTCRGIGRDPAALVRVAEATGLNVVMGSGYYLQSSHPPALAGMDADAIADEIVAEAEHGVDGVPIGIVGEIGVSADFTGAERRSLTGAARAAARTGLPLMVHLPGWERLGHDVLDVAEREGVPPGAVILCHMNPSHADRDYQHALARRGAFVEYDMIGMDFWYDDQKVQCPDDEAAATAIAALCESGHADRILLSQDVFLKMMLTRNGGNGYAHVPRNFLPRLARHGLDPATLRGLMIDNPRRALSRRIVRA